MAIVAGVVIETQPGRADHVAAGLSAVPGLTLYGGDGDRRLAAVWKARDARALEHSAEELMASHPDVLGVFPTFVGEDGGGL